MLALTAVGAVVTLIGGLTISYPHLTPEIKRRERIANRYLGSLKEQYRLEGSFAPFVLKGWPPGPSASGLPGAATGFFGPPLTSYIPKDGADQQRWYAAIEKPYYIDGQVIRRAQRMQLTDGVVYVVGAVLLALGTLVASLGSVL